MNLFIKTLNKQFPSDNQSNSKTYGVLYLKSELDFELEKEFNLDICASNINPISPNRNTEQMAESEPCVKVKITVKDVNEPPVFSKDVFEARGNTWVDWNQLNGSKINLNFSRWKFTNRNANLYWPIGMPCNCKRPRRRWICFATTRQKSTFCHFHWWSTDCKWATWPWTKRRIPVRSHRNGFIFSIFSVINFQR